jgi:chromate transporter
VSARPTPMTVPLAEALRFWLKLGFISFGGPAGQIAIMHRELVEQRRWISEKRFLHAFNYCMLLPGPEAQQLATYIGWLMHRTWGGVVAGALFVLPSLFILIALSWVYLAFGDVPLVAGLFYGIKPAVAAIVLHAVAHWQQDAQSPRRTPCCGRLRWQLCGHCGAENSLPLGGAGGRRHRLAGCALGAGAVRGRWRGTAAPASHGPALIDDDTPTPAHARFSRKRLAQVAVVGALLWLVPMGVLVAPARLARHAGPDGLVLHQGGLMTFGGAYAVLPYVYQGAVEQFGWLTGPQMIDGLALGETTPGPLIMVVAFVGFVGGWAKQVLGPDMLFLGAALAATW